MLLGSIVVVGSPRHAGHLEVQSGTAWISPEASGQLSLRLVKIIAGRRLLGFVLVMHAVEVESHSVAPKPSRTNPSTVPIEQVG